jgi:hypothetical protein
MSRTASATETLRTSTSSYTSERSIRPSPRRKAKVLSAARSRSSLAPSASAAMSAMVRKARISGSVIEISPNSE